MSVGTSQHQSREPRFESELMTRAEAAEYLRVAPATLACWASNGRHAIPFVKLGSKVCYRRGDLDKWLESRTQTST